MLVRNRWSSRCRPGSRPASRHAPVAELATEHDYGSGCKGFDSSRARQFFNNLRLHPAPRQSPAHRGCACTDIRQGLGHLDREAVPIEVILIAVLGEPFAREARRPIVTTWSAITSRPPVGRIVEEIGDAEPAFVVLARE